MTDTPCLFPPQGQHWEQRNSFNYKMAEVKEAIGNSLLSTKTSPCLGCQVKFLGWGPVLFTPEHFLQLHLY